MYLISLDLDSRTYFATITILIALPTALKLTNWTHTHARQLTSHHARTLTLSFLILFTLGGVTGLLVANTAVDVLLHDTYFVVAHFHYVLSLGAVLGILILHIALKIQITRAQTNAAGEITTSHAVVGCAQLVFTPQHATGMAALPRRTTDFPNAYHGSTMASTHGAFALLAGVTQQQTTRANQTGALTQTHGHTSVAVAHSS